MKRKRSNTKNSSASSAAKKGSARLEIDWIPGLAEPYLRGYQATREERGALRGYRFARKGSGATMGFFAGYLWHGRGWAFLGPHGPECMVFAFVQPVGGRAHKTLVVAEDALVRTTFEYIRWLTHRPPRFQFFEKETAALIRHVPVAAWPARRMEHYSRNFFIETLAWLVRSALVRKFREQGAGGRE